MVTKCDLNSHNLYWLSKVCDLLFFFELSYCLLDQLI